MLSKKQQPNARAIFPEQVQIIFPEQVQILVSGQRDPRTRSSITAHVLPGMQEDAAARIDVA
jgi:hypothetical protein